LDRAVNSAVVCCVVLAAALLPAAGCATQRTEARPPGFWQRMVARSTPAETPRLEFRLIADIPVPGPLAGEALELADGSVRIPVVGGTVLTGWEEGAQPELLPGQSGQPAVTSDGWAYDPSGKYRSRVTDDGRLVTERRCRTFCSGWNKIWRLRQAGVAVAPPLLTETRVYAGGSDNRVYSLRKKNGHRVWVADVGQRVVNGVALWKAPPPVDATSEASLMPPDFRAILANPGAGTELLALDTRTGQVAARFELAEDSGRLRGAPLVLPDGRIAVGREKYNSQDASLMVLELGEALQPSATPTEPPAEDADADQEATPPAESGEPRTRERRDDGS